MPKFQPIGVRMAPKASFSEQVKSERTRRGLSLKEAAKKLKIGWRYLYSIEAGKRNLSNNLILVEKFVKFYALDARTIEKIRAKRRLATRRVSTSWGRFLRSAMAEKGINATELHKRSGVASGTISKLLNGRLRAPRPIISIRLGVGLEQKIPTELRVFLSGQSAQIKLQPVATSLSRFVIAEMTRQGMNRTQLSQRSGLGAGMLSDIINGRVTKLVRKTRERLFVGLRCDLTAEALLILKLHHAPNEEPTISPLRFEFPFYRRHLD